MESQKTNETTKVNALVLGYPEYGEIFRGIQRKIGDYAKRIHNVSLDFTHDYFPGAEDAWERTRRSPHDVYFIDGAVDVPVLHNRAFSEAVKDLYPNSVTVGMSAVSRFLTRDAEGHYVYDVVVNMSGLSEGVVSNILNQFGFIPESMFSTERREDDEMDRLKSHPKLTRIMEEEGY